MSDAFFRLHKQGDYVLFSPNGYRTVIRYVVKNKRTKIRSVLTSEARLIWDELVENDYVRQ